LASKLNTPTPSVSKGALEKLQQHNWPGNVRELKNVIERAAILSEGSVIDTASILFSHELGKAGASASQNGPCRPADHCDLRSAMAEYEQRLIGHVMQECRSIRQAARRLGISHTALMNKLKKHKMQMERK